ncbi:hypothetical protein CXB51_034529 [Gossypium anomalum]|uniref:Glycosyl transferase 48 domain-containing protein n=1 Tax=Gossypium anomalum TaxID=47600 RepID=A0A8J5Y8V8_9ROSI|nr:hypothetical protein CXB51_034529 [Gossypium anomalum]
MSNQETSLVIIGQKVLARPLKYCFHYGHPDMFNRIFHITCGGINKGSHGINLSDDIFAGRDVGLNQISLFEAKVVCGNGEQTLSRDIYKLGHRFDFFHILLFPVWVSLSGLEEAILKYALARGNNSLRAAMASHLITGLERGFRTVFSDIIIMQFQLAAVFFTFFFRIRVHYFGRTISHGGAKYRATGRGSVVRHEKSIKNYRLYSMSHFVKGLELMVLLICYRLYGSAIDDVEDWEDLSKCISCRGEHLRHTGFIGHLFEIILSICFFIYQYGIVYHLNMTTNSRQMSMGRMKFSADFQLMFRLLKLLLLIGYIVTTAMLFYFLNPTVRDIFQSILAFMLTGWALLQISQACRTLVKGIGMLGSVKALARGYEYMMGVFLFASIVILAWFPFVSEFQIRLLFN